MKKVLLSLMALVVMGGFSTLQAKVVDRDEALEVATDFFRTHNIATLSTSEVREVWNSSQLTTTGVATLSATETPTFYVFAPETGKGFVIVSADDCTESILAYSDKDTFVTDNMPCGFLWWCETMNKQIANYRATGTESVKKEARQGISTLAASEMLIETASWNQDAPYNNECPYDGSTRSYTGCVSTSFAIAMRYHTHPTTGSGQTETYTTETKKLTVASRDLSSHTYDWSNMPLEYGNSYTDAQATAVATLMADIGATLQADYTSDNAGTSTTTGSPTPPLLYEHFNYSSSEYYVLSDAFTDADWTELMKNEIATNGPIPYSSTGLSHQFILDGYNSNNQFHINWGWGGSYNGYYLLPDIVTGTDTQRAFLDFIPDDGKKVTTLELSNYNNSTGLVANTTVFAQNASFKMGEVYFVNGGAVDFNGVVAYGLTDSEGNIKEFISHEAGLEDIQQWNVTGLYEMDCNISTTIEAGDCIRLLFKDDEASEWRSMLPYNSGLTYKIEITQDMIGDPVEYEYVVKIYSVGLSTETTVFRLNDTFTITVGIANESLKAIDKCYFKPALCNSDGNIKEWLSDGWSFGNFGSWSAYSMQDDCVITDDLQPNDRVRLFYQANNTIEGQWKLVEPDGDVAWEIVITEDMIKSFHDSESGLYYNITSETGVEVTYGGTSNSTGTPAYAGAFDIPESVDFGSTTYNVVGIGENAFRGCSPDNGCALTAITIPNSVTYIGERAFQNCPSLTEIIIPNSVTSMGGYTFFDCSNLQTVVIGDGIETIWGYTFRYCRGLESLTIGEKVSTIEECAFDTTALTSVTSLNPTPPTCSSSAFSGFTRADTPLYVPVGSYESYSTASIWSEFHVIAIVNAENKFYDVNSGLFFNILDETTEVEVTFENEDGEAIPYTLESIDIPESVTYDGTTYTVVGFGYQAFNGCENLTSVTYPSSVTYIGEQAFSNCTKLSNIELLETLTEIGDYAFSGCSALTGELTIPNSVVTIGDDAFNGCSGLTSVVIGSGVKTIGASAFQFCEKLSSVTFGENVVSIGGTAFASTILEGELVIPNKVTSIGEWAFSGCDKLTSLTLGSSLTTIGGSAFNSCDGLTVVTSLNTTPPTCGEDVFGSVETSAIPLYVPLGCSSVYLADKTWGEFNVMEIVNVGDKIYDSTSGLYYNILSDTEVEVTWGGEYDCSGTTEYTGEITIPETITYGGVTYNVTKIGDYAFSYCEITSISIPSWVTSIGGGIVSGCQSLKTIEVAEDNLNYCAVDNVLFSKDRTTLIQYPAGLESTSYDIPQGVTTIGFEAFCFNFNLTSVTFPNSVTTIGEKAFYCCNNLASIDIPDNVISIEDYAFYSCDAAKTITIGNGVISIGANGFNMCRYVETITIGSSVETIGEFAFLNAGYNLSANDKVKLSILNPVPPTLGDRAFSNIYTTMYVPAGTLAEYKRVWGEASNIPGLNAYAELGYAVLKIGTTSYATYYNEDYGINLTDTGIKAYWASEIENDEDNNNVVSLVNIGTTIPAKTAVVLQGAQTDLTEASATASSAESTYSSNMLHGQSTTGTISTEDGYLYYILSVSNTDGEVGFFYGASGGGAFESAANKAWLAVSSGMANSLSIKFKDSDEGGTTGLSSVSTNYGEGDGNIYTIQGIRVNDMSRPGVYIVNGKKILVK